MANQAFDPRLDRTRWYPGAGAYLRAWRRGTQLTATGGGVAVDWHGTPLDAAAFTRFMRRALDRRLNHKAALLTGTPEREPRTPEYLYQRDRHRLDDHLRRHVRISQFETRAVREGFGHLLCTPGEE